MQIALTLKRRQKWKNVLQDFFLLPNWSICFHKHVQSHSCFDNQFGKKYFDRFNGELKSLLSSDAVFISSQKISKHFFSFESLKNRCTQVDYPENGVVDVIFSKFLVKCS